LASTKSTTMLTQRVLAQIGACLNFLAITEHYLPFLRSINRNQTSQSRNVPQRTHAPQLAIRLSWLLTKSCGLATTYIFY
jgi:hypothetical protein